MRAGNGETKMTAFRSAGVFDEWGKNSRREQTPAEMSCLKPVAGNQRNDGTRRFGDRDSRITQGRAQSPGVLVELFAQVTVAPREKDLSKRRKGDKAKVKLARRLRSETIMTLRWIADRLQMGSWTYVSN
jgi:hypothetical protein